MSLLQQLSNTDFAVWMRESESIWAYPTILFLHTFGLGLLVGFTTAIDFRVLGFSSRLPLAPMERFFRYVWIGFWINAVSGTLLLVMAPAKLSNPAFGIKMTCIGLGIVNAMWLKRLVFRRGPAGENPAVVSAGGKMLAVASLVVWSGAILAGRLMAYVGARG
jgi:hypothetical protein